MNKRLKHLIMITARSRAMTFGCDSKIPERNIALGYLFYICVGFVLLLMPWSVTEGSSATVVDHLFTATSAVSTTGLASVDVPSTYSAFGMCVILFLIQAGGIGYMTITSYLMLHITHKMSDRSQSVLQTSISTPYGMNIASIINNVVHFTLIFEALGFVALWITFGALGVSIPAWNALFTTVSSFCTAGFSTFSDSLCSFRGNYAVNLIVAALSYAGAMGFIVITDLRHKSLNRKYKITFTTRVIVSITFWMTVAGMTILLLFPGAHQSEEIPTRILEAFFQTMSAMTTVGYNTFDLSTLAPAGCLILSIIMFVGASPSGTGGGVKCTTLSAVYAFVVSMLRGKKVVSLRGNRLPSYRVTTALNSIIVYGGVLLTGTLLLTVSERFPLESLLFETTSALGTVGISLGITPELSVWGKIIIIGLMYAGRIGVLTLGAALMSHAIEEQREKKADLAI